MKRRNFLSGILALPLAGKAIAANKTATLRQSEETLTVPTYSPVVPTVQVNWTRLIIGASIPSNAIRVKARIKPEGGGARDCMDQYHEIHDQERYAGHCEFATGWRADPMRKYELVHVKVETPDGWQTIYTKFDSSHRAEIIAVVNGT